MAQDIVNKEKTYRNKYSVNEKLAPKEERKKEKYNENGLPK